jgi:drug/metabolite transporter (DMT)-like permease
LPLDRPLDVRHLTFKTLVFLVLPPMMWAGNAVVGRLMVGLMPRVLMMVVGAFGFGQSMSWRPCGGALLSLLGVLLVLAQGQWRTLQQVNWCRATC